VGLTGFNCVRVRSSGELFICVMNLRVPYDLGFIDKLHERSLSMKKPVRTVNGQVVPYPLAYIMTSIRVSRSPEGFG
jgi:hypothetical protein